MREGTIYVQHPTDGLTAIGPEDEIPDWAVDQVHERHLGGASGDQAAAELGGPFDPSTHTVEEVNEYLSGDDVTDEERARVLAAEDDGKARAGIVNGPHAE